MKEGLKMKIKNITYGNFACQEITSQEWDEPYIYINDYLGEDTEVIVPSRINEKPVIAVMFETANKAVKSIVLSKGIKFINANGFSNFEGLTDITIPGSIKTIGESAFWGCSGLQEIHIPESVHVLSSNTFRGCAKLRCVEGKNISFISKGAFFGCAELKECIVSDNARISVEYDEFKDTYMYKQAVKNNKALIIGSTLVNGTHIKGDYTVPADVKWIASKAFLNNYSMTSIKIGANIDMLFPNTFEKCIVLEYVYMSTAEIESIPKQCFMNCFKLKKVILPVCCVKIGSSAFYSSGISSINLERIKVIEDEAFAHSKMDNENLTLPSLEILGDNCFFSTAVSNVFVDESKVKFLGKNTDINYIFL